MNRVSQYDHAQSTLYAKLFLAAMEETDDVSEASLAAQLAMESPPIQDLSGISAALSQVTAQPKSGKREGFRMMEFRDKAQGERFLKLALAILPDAADMQEAVAAACLAMESPLPNPLGISLATGSPTMDDEMREYARSLAQADLRGELTV